MCVRRRTLLFLIGPEDAELSIKFFSLLLLLLLPSWHRFCSKITECWLSPELVVLSCNSQEVVVRWEKGDDVWRRSKMAGRWVRMGVSKLLGEGGQLFWKIIAQHPPALLRCPTTSPHPFPPIAVGATWRLQIMDVRVGHQGPSTLQGC